MIHTPPAGNLWVGVTSNLIIERKLNMVLPFCYPNR